LIYISFLAVLKLVSRVDVSLICSQLGSASLANFDFLLVGDISICTMVLCVTDRWEVRNKAYASGASLLNQSDFKPSTAFLHSPYFYLKTFTSELTLSPHS